MRILDLDQRATPESAVEAHVALPESMPSDRAFVRLNMISSVDGGTAVGGDVVRGRLQLAETNLVAVRDLVGTLDPAPVAAAAAAYHRGLLDALATHPAGSVIALNGRNAATAILADQGAAVAG